MKSRAKYLFGGSLLLVAGISPLASARALAAPTRTVPSAGVKHVSLHRASLQFPQYDFAQRTRAGAASGAYARGLVDLRRQRYAAAEKEFKAAIAHRDHLVQAYAGLGTAAIGLRDFITALNAYRHGAALSPRDPNFQYRASYSALYADDFHAAVKYATAYIHLRPKDPAGYHLRFLSYGNLLQAKEQLQDAHTEVTLQPKNASAYDDLGIALANSHQYKQAERILTQAIKLQPKNGLFWSNRGQAEYQNRQLVAALHDFQRALVLTTDPTRRKLLVTAISFLKKKTHH